MKPEILKLIEENEEIVEKNLYRWIAGYKKKKSEFKIPTNEEIIAYFNENGYIADEVTCKLIRKTYEGKKEGKWIDSYGNEVKNWKGKLQRVWFRNAMKAAVKHEFREF